MALNQNPLGIYEKALIQGSIPNLLSQAQELGFDFMELSIDESEERSARLDWNQEDCELIRKAIATTGVRIPSICLSINRLYPLGAKSDETRRTGIEVVYKAIQLADKLGVRIVQIAGYDHYYDNPHPDNARLYLESLAQCLQEAARYCVTLGIETMDTGFMGSISRFLWSKSQLPAMPWLAVYPDLGNVSALNAYPLHEIELGISSGMIAAVHLKDTLAKTCTSPGQYRDVPFGTGCVDFPAMLQVLARSNYAGPFVLELWNRDQKNLDQASEAKKWFHDLIKSLGEVT